MQQLPERTISFLKLSEKQRKYIIKWMSKVYVQKRVNEEIIEL